MSRVRGQALPARRGWAAAGQPPPQERQAAPDGGLEWEQGAPATGTRPLPQRSLLEGQGPGSSPQEVPGPCFPREGWASPWAPGKMGRERRGLGGPSSEGRTRDPRRVSRAATVHLLPPPPGLPPITASRPSRLGADRGVPHPRGCPLNEAQNRGPLLRPWSHAAQPTRALLCPLRAGRASRPSLGP